MAQPRLLIDATLAAGVEIALDEAQSRHVGTVLRLGIGDGLRLFNAREGEWHAIVSAKAKRGMNVRVEEMLRPARTVPDLDLLFAPVKRHATDLIVEKATELGVRRIRPVITQRTIAETVRLDRLQTIAREAAEQTERFDAPEILAPVSLTKALDGWDAARPLIFADEAGDAAGLLDALQNIRPLPTRGESREGGRSEPSGMAPLAPHLSRPPPPAPSAVGGGENVALLIGPEGGFTPEERRMLRDLAFVIPVSLGPRILRAETAVIAALSMIQAAWGDWRPD